MRLLLIIFIISLGISNSNDKIITLNEPIHDTQSLKVNISYSLGDFVLEHGQDNMAVTGFLKYNSNNFDGELEYDRFGSHSILNLETNMDIDFDWEFNENKKDPIYNEAELYISPLIPVSLDLDVGMGNSIISLDKIDIGEFFLECGLCDAQIDIGKNRNPIECRKLDVDAGLGTIKIDNLLNANANDMDFNCGLGTMELDFTGEVLQDINVDIMVGLGSVAVIFQTGTNVIFNYDSSFLSNVELSEFNHRDDAYYSIPFVENSPSITITGSIGAGTLDIKWIDN